MTNRPKELAIENASAGMVLFDDVLGARSEILLPASTVLSDDMLVSLRRRGTLLLRVVDTTLCEPEPAIDCEQLQARLDYLFRHCGENRSCHFLRQQILEYRLGSSD